MSPWLVRSYSRGYKAWKFPTHQLPRHPVNHVWAQSVIKVVIEKMCYIWTVGRTIHIISIEITEMVLIKVTFLDFILKKKHLCRPTEFLTMPFKTEQDLQRVYKGDSTCIRSNGFNVKQTKCIPYKINFFKYLQESIYFLVEVNLNIFLWNKKRF